MVGNRTSTGQNKTPLCKFLADPFQGCPTHGPWPHAAQIAVNAAQHKIINVLKTLWGVFVITCHNVFNMWPKTTLLPVWPRDAKRLDTLLQAVAVRKNTFSNYFCLPKYYCIFRTIRCTSPPNLGGKWGCVLQSECSLHIYWWNIMLFMLLNILPHFFASKFFFLFSSSKT